MTSYLLCSAYGDTIYAYTKAILRKKDSVLIAFILTKDVFRTKLLQAYVQYVYIVYVK